MIIVLLMSLVFLFYDMLGSFVNPFFSFTQLLHKCSTHTGIHVCLLGTKVQINWKLGFSTTHQIVWIKLLKHLIPLWSHPASLFWFLPWTLVLCWFPLPPLHLPTVKGYWLQFSMSSVLLLTAVQMTPSNSQYCPSPPTELKSMKKAIP